MFFRKKSKLESLKLAVEKGAKDDGIILNEKFDVTEKLERLSLEAEQKAKEVLKEFEESSAQETHEKEESPEAEEAVVSEEALQQIQDEDIKDILDELEKYCLAVFMNTSNEDTRNRMLKIFGRIKLIKASKDSPIEDLIRLVAGERIPEDKIEELGRLGLVDVEYKITGQLDIAKKSKEELSKEIEKLIKMEYRIPEDILKFVNGLPCKVEEEDSKIAEILFKTGMFEIYLLPKGWMSMPNVADNMEVVETATEKIEVLIEKLPQHLKKFLTV
jgi:hypothetical protein